MTRKKKVEMEVINARAAGIDVGSRSHFVAVGQGKEEVKEFGVYAQDLSALCGWLKSCEVSTVAMESTGDYWQNLYKELISQGFEVLLVNGKFAKNISGKKTDVKDCQWIQKMHMLDLLRGSFLPDDTTEKLRTYCRQRQNWLELAANATRKMQKFLKLLNFRLDVVVRDVCGLTGQAIIKDICSGNLDPVLLAKHRHFNCRKSQQEIAKALEGNNKEEYLFGLEQEYDSWQFFQGKIAACDEKIDAFLHTLISQQPAKAQLQVEEKPYKRINKNAPKVKQINQVIYQYFDGVDLLAIEGVSHATIFTLMSEVGPDGLSKFPSAKHFTSWLRLAPNNKISGGKLLSRRTPKGSNRLKVALRNAAQVIGNLKDTHLSDFFRRVNYKKGRTAAITATARKLAVILWHMLTKKVQYKPEKEYLFLDQKRKLKLVNNIRKNITKFGIGLEDLGMIPT